MTSRILVVEDEVFVAAEMVHVIEEMGLASAGTAADKPSALALADDTEVALVDLNLLDGPTGMQIGEALAQRGIVVMFVTANPSQLGKGVAGTVGVMSKPMRESELRSAISYGVALSEGIEAAPPKCLRLFDLPPAGATAH